MNKKEKTMRVPEFIQKLNEIQDGGVIKLPPIPEWHIVTQGSYIPRTELWYKFSISEVFGAPESVVNLFKDSVDWCRNDYRDLAELAMILNHKYFSHLEVRPILAEIYIKLYRACIEFAESELEANELAEFKAILD